MEGYTSDRLGGLACHVIGDVGRYATALYGAAAVLQDNPEIDKAVYAGIGFAVASAIKYISALAATKSDGNRVIEMTSELETKLKE